MNESVENRETKECPHCAETILKKAKICRHCKRSVEDNDPDAENHTPVIHRTPVCFEKKGNVPLITAVIVFLIAVVILFAPSLYSNFFTDILNLKTPLPSSFNLKIKINRTKSDGNFWDILEGNPDPAGHIRINGEDFYQIDKHEDSYSFVMDSLKTENIEKINEITVCIIDVDVLDDDDMGCVSFLSLENGLTQHNDNFSAQIYY